MDLSKLLKTQATSHILSLLKNGKHGWTIPRLRLLRYGCHLVYLYRASSTNNISGEQIFYFGSGKVCAVVAMENQSLPVNHRAQSYQCEKDVLLDDPFEGEIFTFWLQFFGGLSDTDKKALWEVKRPQLVSVDYQMGNFGPITVQKGMLMCKSSHLNNISPSTGYWFSSHETWKALQMPYYDIDIVR